MKQEKYTLVKKDMSLISNVKQIITIETFMKEFPHSQTMEKRSAQLTRAFQYMRHIRGDGNCFYRSVMYGYMELLTLKGPDFLQTFLFLVESNKGLHTWAEDTKLVLPVFGDMVKKIIFARKRTVDSGLKLLHILVNRSPEFDLSLTTILRRMIYNFILNNSDKAFNGISFREAADGNLDNLLNESLLINGESAHSLFLIATPMVLRIGLGNFVLDLEDVDCEEEAPEEDFPAACAEYDERRGDSLDLHGEKINVLLIPGHYELFYPHAFIKKYPQLKKEETQNKKSKEQKGVLKCQFIKIQIAGSGEQQHIPQCLRKFQRFYLLYPQIPTYDILPIEISLQLCPLCSKYSDNLKQMHSCGILCDKDCYLESISTQTQGKMLLTKEEKKNMDKNCPLCKSSVKNKDLLPHINPSIIEEYKKKKKSKEEVEKLKMLIEYFPNTEFEMECCKKRITRQDFTGLELKSSLNYTGTARKRISTIPLKDKLVLYYLKSYSGVHVDIKYFNDFLFSIFNFTV